MSLLRIKAALVQFCEAFENPILLKELLGAFRRPRYMFLLSVLLSLVALSLIGAMLSISGEGGDPSKMGRQAFIAFFAVELVVVALVFPAFSCTAIVEEHIGKSFDLLVTTRLLPHQIVLGKLLASLVYGLTFITATAPFVAITFLYGGVTLGQILLAYFVLLVVGVVVTSYGLMISSLAKTTVRAVVRTFIVLPGVAFLVLYPLLQWIVRPLLYAPLVKDAKALQVRSEIFGYDLLNTFLMWGGVVAWTTTWVGLFFLVTCNRIKPPAADRSTSLRVWLLVSWSTLLALFCASLIHNGPFQSKQYLELLPIFFGLSLIVFCGATVAFAVSDKEEAARHPAHSSVLRYLMGPRSGAGALYVMLLALASYSTLVIVFTLPLDAWRHVGVGQWRSPLTILLWGGTWSLVFLLALTQAAVLLSRLSDKAGTARVWLCVALGAVVILPTLIYRIESKSFQRADGSVLKGYTLSPVTVAFSIIQRPQANDRRLMVFAPSAEQIARLAPDIRPSTSARGRRELLDRGVEAHKLSTFLYLLAGLVLLVWNARMRPRPPPARRYPGGAIHQVDPPPEALEARVAVPLPASEEVDIDLGEVAEEEAEAEAEAKNRGTAENAEKETEADHDHDHEREGEVAPPPATTQTKIVPPRPSGTYTALPDDDDLIVPAEDG